jgi:phenylacetic acid degradation operon negative regulatory protein
MLGELGVEAGGVRSSVSRLKRRSTLESVRLGHTAAYRLSPSLEEVFREGDDRIFGRRQRSMQQWGLIAVSVPESERNKRHQIRSTLTRFGFGSVIPGLWIAPSSLVEYARLHLERMGLSQYAEYFDANYLDRPLLREKIAKWWNLDALELTYATFLEEYQPMRARWTVDPAENAGPEVHRAAFVDYVLLLTGWRRLPYLDPGLPLEFLPQPWSGLAAEDLFADLHHALAAPARRHAEAILAASSDLSPSGGADADQ